MDANPRRSARRRAKWGTGPPPPTPVPPQRRESVAGGIRQASARRRVWVGACGSGLQPREGEGGPWALFSGMFKKELELLKKTRDMILSVRSIPFLSQKRPHQSAAAECRIASRASFDTNRSSICGWCCEELNLGRPCLVVALNVWTSVIQSSRLVVLFAPLTPSSLE